MIEGIRREAAWISPLVALIALIGGVLGTQWWRNRPAPVSAVAYSTFLGRLDSGEVAELVIVPGSEIRGVWGASLSLPRYIPRLRVGGAA